ncbi:MAG: hypothetical protein HY040_16625 [Planctomycetes bacterium]|nr:hypothetical protein [Planctomycetota bacterium]
MPVNNMPVNGAMAAGNPTRVAPPKIRMQAPEPTSTSARLVLPSPEELGVAVQVPAQIPPHAARPSLDWNRAHTRLQELGAVGFHLDRLPQGSCRVTFLLPTSQPQRTHHVEAEAANEADAVRNALEQAETWRVSQR